MNDYEIIINKKAFFLRHTAQLSSSTSQLVWPGPCLVGGGVLFHYHFWGVVLFHYHLQGGGVLFHHHFQGEVLFHHHFQGGPLPPPLPGRGSSSTTTSREGGPLPPPLPGGVPCDLSHNGLIYRYRIPQCIMGKIHMKPPPPPPRVEEIG